MSLNLTQLRLIVTRYIPQTLQTQLQLLLEAEPELHVFLAQQFDVPAVLLKFPLQFLYGLPHPPVLHLLQRRQLRLDGIQLY
jgi:hypothetical protein